MSDKNVDTVLLQDFMVSVPRTCLTIYHQSFSNSHVRSNTTESAHLMLQMLHNAGFYHISYEAVLPICLCLVDAACTRYCTLFRK